MISATRLYKVLLILVIPLVALALYMTFIFAPPEKVMGAVQRLFYFHVASAIASYASFALLFFASIGYLATKSIKYDLLSVASAEVGFLLTTIVLGSGMIWARPIWGVWFNAEPRLVTFLLLWFLLIAYLALRHFGDGSMKATYSAVLGIIICLSVPLMVLSIKILPAFKQLHPQVIEKGGLHSDMRFTLLVTIIALLVFQGLLVTLRYRLTRIEKRADL